MFDSSLSMRDHVNQVCKKGYHQLTKIRQIKRYMDKPAIESVLYLFVTSGMDYCNAVLFRCPTNVIDRVQKLQNCAARVVVGVRKFELLKELHWLPVTSRINYKIAFMVFKCLHGQAPGYLTDLIVKYEPVRNLRSSKNNDLCVPKTKRKTLGSRAFIYASPSVWNSLPKNLKLCDSLTTFKSLLKTYLFSEAYNV